MLGAASGRALESSARCARRNAGSRPVWATRRIGGVGGGLLEGLRLRGRSTTRGGRRRRRRALLLQARAAARPKETVHLHSFLKYSVSAGVICSSEAFCRMSMQRDWLGTTVAVGARAAPTSAVRAAGAAADCRGRARRAGAGAASERLATGGGRRRGAHDATPAPKAVPAPVQRRRRGVGGRCGAHGGPRATGAAGTATGPSCGSRELQRQRRDADQRARAGDDAVEHALAGGRRRPPAIHEGMRALGARCGRRRRPGRRPSRGARRRRSGGAGAAAAAGAGAGAGSPLRRARRRGGSGTVTSRSVVAAAGRAPASGRGAARARPSPRPRCRP